MGEWEVFGWLAARVESERFYSTKEVAKGSGVLGTGYSSARVCLNRLYAYGYVELYRPSLFQCYWRARKDAAKRWNVRVT